MSRPKSSGPGSKSASGSGSGKKAGGGFRIPNPFRGRGRSGGSSGSRPSSKPSPKPSGSGTRPGGPKPTGPGHRPGKFIKDVVAGIRSKTNPTKANASKPTQQKNPGKPGVPNGGKKVDTSGPSNVTDTGGGWRPGRQKNQNQPIGGHKPPHRPSHTNTTGGSTMGHGGAAFGFQDKSLIGFGESLKQVPDEIDEMRIKYEAMATAAEEEQPIGNGVSEGLREMARLLAMAGQIGQELHPTYRNQNEADIERYENPRKGSHSVEGRADVQSAQRDV